MQILQDRMKNKILNTLLLVLFIIIGLCLVSSLLEPLLPEAFEVLDFFSEICVLTFALLWFLILQQIGDPMDRVIVTLGISLFALGAFADLLDEFGIKLVIRSFIENLSFVGGFLLVSLGLRDWVKNNYKQYKEIIEKNEFLAFHDALTGLHNRESLLRALPFKIGRHEPGSDIFSIILCDLNRFKTINDTLGHSMGDLLLQEVAARMKEVLRDSDHCFRIGGDEFIILASDIRKEENAFVICQKISDRISQPYELQGHKIITSGSFGIALYPRDGDSPEALLRNADLAMYAAKKMNKDIEFFSEDLSIKASKKLRLENDLRKALENEDLFMVYQPIVSMDGHLVALEALLRWNHPEKGAMNPESYICVAEETGMILPLGEFILRKSFEEYKNNFENSGFSMDLNVNISAVQLEDPQFVSKVLSIAKEYKMDFNKIVLEITESVVISHLDRFLNRMSPLLEVGIRFAMDDFGSGYSSLNYLKRLPIDIIKFDKELVNSSENSRNDLILLNGLVKMMNDLGKRVIVEGIENKEQADYFSTERDLLFQGFYFSHPKSKEQIKDWK